MPLFRQFKIRSKLALLIGAPLLGAVVLAGIVVEEAREQVAAAAALGNVSDLAEFALRTNDAIHQLQMERAELAESVAAPLVDPMRVQSRQEGTDRALVALDAFLRTRDIRRLPPGFGRGLEAAKKQLDNIKSFRRDVAAHKVSLETILEFYGKANRHLMNVAAILVQLSDAGDLLRKILSLDAITEVKEIASREHALLAGVAPTGEFPPGMYRYYVALITEESVQIEALRSVATEEEYALYSAVRRWWDDPAEVVSRAAAIRARFVPRDWADACLDLLTAILSDDGD